MSFIISFTFIPLEMVDLNKIEPLLEGDAYLVSDNQAKELKELIKSK